jgi:hypothetical protein
VAEEAESGRTRSDNPPEPGFRGVLEERDALRRERTELTRRLQTLEQWRAGARGAVTRVADALDLVREALLDYDASTDKHGHVWDDRIRIAMDVSLKQAEAVLRQVAE